MMSASPPVNETNAATATTTTGDDVVTIRGISADGLPFTYIGPVDEASKACGKGRRTYDNGNVYEGDFENDNMHGHGTYTFANGRVYVGEWVAGKPEGHGTMSFDGGGVYVGEWVAGQKEGHGTYTSPWNIYIGEWVADKQEGHGTQTWSDGDVDYDGQWLEGTFDPGGIRTQQRLQRKRDEAWARRRGWMIATSPFIKGKEVTESPIQEAVFNIPGIYRHVTSLL